jgi:hypothetical protein
MGRQKCCFGIFVLQIRDLGDQMCYIWRLIFLVPFYLHGLCKKSGKANFAACNTYYVCSYSVATLTWSTDSVIDNPLVTLSGSIAVVQDTVFFHCSGSWGAEPHASGRWLERLLIVLDPIATV